MISDGIIIGSILAMRNGSNEFLFESHGDWITGPLSEFLFRNGKHDPFQYPLKVALISCLADTSFTDCVVKLADQKTFCLKCVPLQNICSMLLICLTEINSERNFLDFLPNTGELSRRERLLIS